MDYEQKRRANLVKVYHHCTWKPKNIMFRLQYGHGTVGIAEWQTDTLDKPDNQDSTQNVCS